MSKIFFLLGFLFIQINGFTQATNNDYKLGPMNVVLPKTPESQGFEKYGNIPVSEFTGTPNISVPIYNLKTGFLEVPITLSYSPTGIKVSQEASWVGLGFDLIAGGRITVETKGSVDDDGTYWFSPTTLKYGMNKLFTRLGTSNPLAILTFASTCQYCDTAINHNVPDDWASVNAMSQFGLGEPDIFHANFMGHSFSFFFDKITDSLKFLGEKNFFNINLNRDSYNRILDWTIQDNQGITYYFKQRETTTVTLPPLGAIQNATSTSAWLLTKILHPTGDSVVFSYTNYGSTYPISDWSSSMNYREKTQELSLSNDNQQNSVVQQPSYLTKIESKDVAIDFILGNRDDLKGAGSKRLNEIRISDKLTSTVKQKATFSYDYFIANLNSCYSSLPDSVTKYYRQRLRLNTVTTNDSGSLQPPYQFFYNSGASVPLKTSFDQDHWGYYNGAGNTSAGICSPKNLLPNTGLGNEVNNSTLNGFAASRDCNPLYMGAMALDSIIYPTGGSTKFIFEPHQSSRLPNIQVTGGGLRIKTIRSYASGRLANTFEYSYGSGVYMGTIQYRTSYWGMYPSIAYVGVPISQQDSKFDNLLANGASNDNDLLIAYSSVTTTQKDEKGASNGYVTKRFGVSYPAYGNTGVGFDAWTAHWPTGTICDNTGCLTYNNSTDHLYASYSGFAPTPKKDLDGKILQEKFYDNNSSLLKSVDYYYTQADFSQKFYSIRVRDNRIGGSDANGTNEFEVDGSRRYTIFVSPAKSFFTITDSVIENIYQGANVLKTKKAYKYNSHYQPEWETIFNSDGTQTITYSKTSVELGTNYPLSPTGDALTLYYLKSNHIYDLPIEQTVMKRNVAGDTVVIQSKLAIYDKGLPTKVYGLETVSPVTYRSQFIPLYCNYTGYPSSPTGSSYTLQMDSRYKLYNTADYSASGQIKALHTLQGNTSYIWDEYYDNLQAQANNADSSDIAFTSFETPSKGRWIYNANGIVADGTSPGGKKSYSLSLGAISISSLNTTKSFIVSYWCKSSSSQTVNGATGTVGPTINGWTYFEHLVSNTSSISITGTGIIDQLRLYPSTSLMTSYVYEPLIGLSSQNDVGNRISYYEYDNIGRLSRIRDQKRNILKQFEYKYGDIFQFPYGNTSQSQNYYKNNCPSGYDGSIYVYTVPANKYGSFISVSDANQKALTEIAGFDGQTIVNQTGYCSPHYSFVACCGWNGMYSNFSLSGTGYVNFSFVVAKQTGSIVVGTSYQVANLSGQLFLPSGIRVFNVSEGGRTWQVQILTGGQFYLKLISGTIPSYASISGTYAL